MFASSLYDCSKLMDAIPIDVKFNWFDIHSRAYNRPLVLA
jgi:hypothetical protein